MTHGDFSKNHELYGMRRAFHKKSLDDIEFASLSPYLLLGNTALKEQGILLIHGFSSTLAIFSELTQRLAADGYTVSAICLPGHGTHPEQLASVGEQEWLQAVEEAYIHLNRQCKQITVIGFSLGGALAIHLAKKYPDIKKLILIAPAISLKLHLRILCSILPFIIKLGLRFLPNLAGDIKKPNVYEIAYGKVPSHALGELYRLTRHTQQILPQLTTETLIFYSPHDHIVDAQLSTRKLISSGILKEKIVWLNNSYHVMLLDNDAGTIINTILKEVRSTI